MVRPNVLEGLVRIAHIGKDGKNFVVHSYMTPLGCHSISGVGDQSWLTGAPGKPSNGEWKELLLSPAQAMVGEVFSAHPILFLSIPSSEYSHWWKDGAEAIRQECLESQGPWYWRHYSLRHGRQLGLIVRDSASHVDKHLKKLLRQLSKAGCALMLDIRSNQHLEPDGEYTSLVLGCLVQPCQLLVPCGIVHNPQDEPTTRLQRIIWRLSRLGTVSGLVVTDVPIEICADLLALSTLEEDLRSFYEVPIWFVLPD